MRTDCSQIAAKPCNDTAVSSERCSLSQQTLVGAGGAWRAVYREREEAVVMIHIHSTTAL